ncbi:MAG: ABC transporter permease [Gorillibacterium sp.]|nr:ABC transporter permease [Gorillibacterium sp.]
MKISTLRRHLREGGKSFFRNGWMTFASVSSITISLFILGLFLVLGINLSHISSQLENDITITAYMQFDATDDVVKEVGVAIKAIPDIKSVKFISKEDALIEMRKTMGDELEGFEGDSNPLPDAYEVQIKKPHEIDLVADKISSLNEGREIPAIDEVKYGKGTIDALFRATAIVRYIAIVFVVCLVFTSMFLISNTIKLTILARSREIKIMKLVGATNSFIRWPFYIEGALIGFMGAIIPTAILVYGYHFLLNYFTSEPSPALMTLSPFLDIAYPITGMLMAIGLVIGIWGSTLSVRKFLKV